MNNRRSPKKRNALFRLPLFTFLLVICVSCGKHTATPGDYQVTELDAAAIMADQLLPQYGGLLTQFNNVLSVSISSNLNCGATKDSVFNGSSQYGSAILFHYQLLSRQGYDCTNQQQRFYINGQGDFEGRNYRSNDKRTGSFTVRSQSQSPGRYRLTVSWQSAGDHRIKTVGPVNFKSTVQFESADIIIDQRKAKIVSGKMAVKMQDTVNGRFDFNGYLTFLGDNKATLILNSGRTYPLSW